MATILCIRTNWNHTAIQLRIAEKFFTLEINPEPEYPFGRKGLALKRAWQQLSEPHFSGMLILDGDVAIDPHDYEAMLKAIDRNPNDVCTTSVKLWPTSTLELSWRYGHGRGEYSQADYSSNLDTFTFCFTYLPRVLIESAIRAGLALMYYPHVDVFVCQQAQKLKLPVHLVREATPKHLNY